MCIVWHTVSARYRRRHEEQRPAISGVDPQEVESWARDGGRGLEVEGGRFCV